jgi:hypothetical protein
VCRIIKLEDRLVDTKFGEVDPVFEGGDLMGQAIIDLLLLRIGGL